MRQGCVRDEEGVQGGGWREYGEILRANVGHMYTLIHHPPPRHLSVFRELDSAGDGDGLIQHNEMVSTAVPANPPATQNPDAPPHQRQRANATPPHSQRAGLEQLGLVFSKHELNEVMKAADDSGDGALNLDEFHCFVVGIDMAKVTLFYV